MYTDSLRYQLQMCKVDLSKYEYLLSLWKEVKERKGASVFSFGEERTVRDVQTICNFFNGKLNINEKDLSWDDEMYLEEGIRNNGDIVRDIVFVERLLSNKNDIDVLNRKIDLLIPKLYDYKNKTERMININPVAKKKYKRARGISHVKYSLEDLFDRDNRVWFAIAFAILTAIIGVIYVNLNVTSNNNDQMVEAYFQSIVFGLFFGAIIGLLFRLIIGGILRGVAALVSTVIWKGYEKYEKDNHNSIESEYLEEKNRVLRVYMENNPNFHSYFVRQAQIKEIVENLNNWFEGKRKRVSPYVRNNFSELKKIKKSGRASTTKEACRILEYERNNKVLLDQLYRIEENQKNQLKNSALWAQVVEKIIYDEDDD